MATQTFLPMLDLPKKIIRGMVAISSTSFDGSETDHAIGGVNYPVQHYAPERSTRGSQEEYTAIVLTPAQYKAEAHRQIPGFISINDMLPASAWTANSATIEKRETFGALIDGLMKGFGSSVTVTTPTPTTGGSAGTLQWDATAPFANQPTCTFVDFNWVSAFAIVEGSDPAFIEVGTNDSAGLLAAVPVAPAQQIIGVINYNTIRIVKMPNAVLTVGSSYVFNFTVRDANGAAIAAALTLTII